MTIDSRRQAILAALADLGGVANTARLRRRLGHRPDPQYLAALQMHLPEHAPRIVQPTPRVYHLTDAGLRELARGANLAAILGPADPDTVAPAEPDHAEVTTHPSITVAGAQAFLYVDGDGVLVLSLHLDTGEVPDWLTRPGRCVPVRVTVNGTDVFTDDRPALRVAAPS